MASRENAGLDAVVAGQDMKAGVAARERAVGGNGPQQGFATGATRSTSEGKVDFEGHLHPDVLAVFGEYMNAHRVQRDGQVRASDNWQKGIPIYRYVKSLVRHGMEFWRMWRGTVVRNPDSGAYFTFREVLCAMLFNVMGIIFETTRRHPGFLDSQALPGWQREQWEREDGEPQPQPHVPVTSPAQMAKEQAAQQAAHAQRDCSEVRFTCPQDGERNCCPERGYFQCRQIGSSHGCAEMARL